MKGEIKTLKPDMNPTYGFIKTETGDKDLFFYQTDVEGGEAEFKKLKLGDKVTFEKGMGDKGPKAVKVKKAKTEEAA
ncbi:cold shock domain-containing protein [archaeon]|nr:cold shock domain-containing protein [archaeon]